MIGNTPSHNRAFDKLGTIAAGEGYRIIDACAHGCAAIHVPSSHQGVAPSHCSDLNAIPVSCDVLHPFLTSMHENRLTSLMTRLIREKRENF